MRSRVLSLWGPGGRPVCSHPPRGSDLAGTSPGGPFLHHRLNESSAESPGPFTCCCCPEPTVQAFGKLQGSHILSIQALGASLVGQWLRIPLSVQGTWVPSLFRELRSHMR